MHFSVGKLFHRYTCIQADACRTQQARYVHTMLIQCWASVADGVPILNQHWANVSCLVVYMPPSKHETLNQCWCNVGPASKTVDWHYLNIVSMFRASWAAAPQAVCIVHVSVHSTSKLHSSLTTRNTCYRSSTSSVPTNRGYTCYRSSRLVYTPLANMSWIKSHFFIKTMTVSIFSWTINVETR